MSFAEYFSHPIIDAHIHFPHPELSSSLSKVMEQTEAQRVNLIATPDLELVNHNPALFDFKRCYPDCTYICGALDYFSAQAEPLRLPYLLAEQVAALHSAGMDGLKILEGKPMVRKILGMPLDGPAYAAMWAEVERLGMPVVWHVADPEEFWDAERCPGWARSSGWFYGDGQYSTKEAFYAEVDHILLAYPGLRIILAHFYFLSADLPRAADFLEAHPNACFDLTPGSEMFFNFSRQPEAARDFFLRYQDQLVYGTDIGASSIRRDPNQGLDIPESLGRAWVVRRFLESEGGFELPDGVQRWAVDGMPLIGIGLPGEVLEKIYHRNFERLFGPEPAMLDHSAAKDLLEHQAMIIDHLADKLVDSPARRVAKNFNFQ